jgi:hypothetical protein
MSTKGKNGGRFHPPMGSQPLRKINELPPLVMFYPHKIVDCKRKKEAKKEKVVIVVHLIINCIRQT